MPDGVFERRLLQHIVRSAKPSEGGETSTLKLTVPVALFSWRPPRIIDVTGDSVHPYAQDPDVQFSPNSWITEIQDYLKDNILLDEHASTERIIHVAKRYTLVEGDLYRHGTNGILLQCITRKGGCEFLAEIHGGECDNHPLSRMLVGKAF
jgi:hypothetical protein